MTEGASVTCIVIYIKYFFCRFFRYGLLVVFLKGRRIEKQQDRGYVQRDVTVLCMLLCSDLFVSSFLQNRPDWLNTSDL